MKCLTPECACETILCRGLCKPCYYRLLRRVQRGHTTWGALAMEGRAARATKNTATPEARREGRLRAKTTKAQVDAEVVENSTWEEKIKRQAAQKVLAQGYVMQPGDLTDELRRIYESVLSS